MGQTNRRPVNLKASVFLAELRRRKIQLELESNQEPQLFLWNVLKPLQIKKGQKNLRYPTKKQSFSSKFFGPSYFEAALKVR